MKNMVDHRNKIIIILLIFFYNVSLACSCFYEPLFCKAIYPEQYIIRAVVKDFPDSEHMKVELLNNIYNEVTENEISVRGNNGAECLQSLHVFESNDTLILALFDISVHNENPNWVLTGHCGLNYLKYENGIVSGQISETETSQPFEEFSSNITSCLGMTTNATEHSIDQQIKVFPNPFLDEFQIELASLNPAKITVYDVNGRQIHQSARDNRSSARIRSKNWPKGMYFIKIQTGDTEITKRICKI